MKHRNRGTVWSGSVQILSNLAAATFMGCCSRANKSQSNLQLKEMLCKGAQKRQNLHWHHWTHSSTSISCPWVALTWVLPCVFFSIEFKENILVSPRGGTGNSLQVTLATHNFHYLYLLSSDECFFKNKTKKIRFPHFVNNSVQNCNIQSVIKNVLIEKNPL